MKAENGNSLTRDQAYSYINENLFKLSSPELKKEHPTWPGYVGMEVEMLPVRNHHKTRIPLPIQRNENLMFSALQSLAEENQWGVVYEDYHKEKLILMLKLPDGDNITFEPGGQLEYSSQPLRCLEDVHTKLKDIQTQCDKVLYERDMGLLQIGMNPWHSVEQIGIQNPKKRYLAMDSYFNKIRSLAGPQMMRKTCSIQVCLDFGWNDSTMVKRYLAAQLIAPALSSLFAYSPFNEEGHIGIHSLRNTVWRSLDFRRSGFVGLEKIAKGFSRQSCVDAYFDFAMSCPVVFVERLNYLVPNLITMQEWMQHGIEAVYPTLDDFKIHLSLLFPEVRPRGYLELRSIDCLPRVWQIAPAAFTIGLLYDEKSLDQVLNAMLPQIKSIDNQMSLAKNGLHTELLHKQAVLLMEWAIEGLQRISTHFCGRDANKILKAYSHRFSERGRTPADDLVDLVRKKQEKHPVLQDFEVLEQEWSELLV